MIVKNVMTKKVITIKSGSNLKMVSEILLKNRISGAPVVDKKGKLIGIISEKDVFKSLFPGFKELIEDVKLWLSHEKLEERAKDVRNILVDNVMIKEVITCDEDTPIMKAGSMMLARNIHRLIVVDEEGKITGVVTRRDIFHRVLQK